MASRLCHCGVWCTSFLWMYQRAICNRETLSVELLQGDIDESLPPSKDDSSGYTKTLGLEM